MPKIDRILETALIVEDISRAVEFYQRVLGFGLLLKTGEPERLAAMDVGGEHILLLLKTGATANDVTLPGGTIPGFKGSGQGHAAFPIATNELSAWKKTLAEHGIAVESTVQWERGGQSIYFRDLDGNLLELATPGVWPTY
ncbi:MAG: VOC family protein [Acidobacteria bacterium]|nr:VOC family protein [Acidobacteriota bacterium]MBS1865694.1 VOC family protein [Acidobacteriota bacterium]